MEQRLISRRGEMVYHCIRLKRGEDLLGSIKAICAEKNIKAGIVLSAVGCISSGKVRDASGVRIREIADHCEIVSLNGTVSAQRCHLHIALSKEDLSTIGGHLCDGCIINTTCELVIGELSDITYGAEDDVETGYRELIFLQKQQES